MKPYRVNEKDVKGNTILRIHDQLTDSNGNMIYSLYDNENHKLNFWAAANNSFNNRIVSHRYIISQLVRLGEQLFEYEKEKFKWFGLKEKNATNSIQNFNPYNAIIANIISSSIVDTPVIPAIKQFQDLKNDFKSQIISRARFVYLYRCLKMVIFVFFMALFLWFYETSMAHWLFFTHFADAFVQSAYIAAAGAVGAFMSVTQKISLLKIDPYLPDRRTILNAFIRISIGMVFGVVLFWILKTDLIKIFSMELLDETNVKTYYMVCLLTGILGGFSERLVPDILSKEAGKDVNTSKSNTPNSPVVPPADVVPKQNNPEVPDDTTNTENSEKNPVDSNINDIVNQPDKPNRVENDAEIPVNTNNTKNPTEPKPEDINISTNESAKGDIAAPKPSKKE
ncbi:hypothetical protein [Ascidiimonas sp. W6]|uniref:hypothetical protein n=1 Tax=Ascidiimonas meishanensis TaxID=3128903 RepID=UPI0030EE8452